MCSGILQALSSIKKKTYMNTIQKCCRLLWTKAHWKQTEAKWKMWWDDSKFDILAGLRLLRTGFHFQKLHPWGFLSNLQDLRQLLLWTGVIWMKPKVIGKMSGTLTVTQTVYITYRNQLIISWCIPRSEFMTSQHCRFCFVQSAAPFPLQRLCKASMSGLSRCVFILWGFYLISVNCSAQVA